MSKSTLEFIDYCLGKKDSNNSRKNLMYCLIQESKNLFGRVPESKFYKETIVLENKFKEKYNLNVK